MQRNDIKMEDERYENAEEKKLDERFPRPEIEVDGILATGKQFDLEIILPEDKREVVYGIVKDCNGCPIEDAVVKLVEVIKFHDKKFRAPVSHTFTDKEGDFTFGPLCPDKKYELVIWKDAVKHKKICVRPHRDFDCLKGSILKCEYVIDYKKPEYEKNTTEMVLPE
jgi:hypothetical protein